MNTSGGSPCNLTKIVRRKNMDHAYNDRATRAMQLRLLRSIKHDPIPNLTALLNLAERKDRRITTVKVKHLLQYVPGVGEQTALTLILSVNIPKAANVGMLSKQQRTMIIATVTNYLTQQKRGVC